MRCTWIQCLVNYITHIKGPCKLPMTYWMYLLYIIATNCCFYWSLVLELSFYFASMLAGQYSAIISKFPAASGWQKPSKYSRSTLFINRTKNFWWESTQHKIRGNLYKIMVRLWFRTWEACRNSQKPIQSAVSRCHKSPFYLAKKYLWRSRVKIRMHQR